jgi:hypothetical protein
MQEAIKAGEERQCEQEKGGGKRELRDRTTETGSGRNQAGT